MISPKWLNTNCIVVISRDIIRRGGGGGVNPPIGAIIFGRSVDPPIFWFKFGTTKFSRKNSLANLERLMQIKNPLRTHVNMEAQTCHIFKRNVCQRPTLVPKRTPLCKFGGPHWRSVWRSTFSWVHNGFLFTKFGVIN